MFDRLDRKLFTFAVKKGFVRTPGLPPRVEALSRPCSPPSVVAALVGVANHFGPRLVEMIPFTVFPQSHHNEPFMPGDRTCSGGAYTFQIPGSLAAQDNVAIPLKVQNAASIRCVYAYLQQGTRDGQSAYVVKHSTDGGATWNVLNKRKGRQPSPAAASRKRWRMLPMTSTSGLVPVLEFGLTNEEHVNVISVDAVNQPSPPS